jgi:hypothetical protein
MPTALIGAVVGALAVLPVAIAKQRLDRSRSSAILEVAKKWFMDRYEQINYFDGQFFRLLHAIEHVRGDRPDFKEGDRGRYFSLAMEMCQEMRDRARSQVPTLGVPFLRAIEETTDAARAWLVELRAVHVTGGHKIDDSQAYRLQQLEHAYYRADDRRLEVRKQLYDERLPPALQLGRYIRPLDASYCMGLPGLLLAVSTVRESLLSFPRCACGTLCRKRAEGTIDIHAPAKHASKRMK